MTYRIDVTKSAERDLFEAARYVAADLQNPVAAGALLDAAAEAIDSLGEMPLRCAPAKDEALAARGIRILPVRNFLVFYAVREEKKTIVIERFLYGRRDWLTILRDGEAPDNMAND
ncbi:MAG: type II toxin-antitoxin system RelE/ParE family toxin [Clostridiales Family XIII bacterium]|jgi:plasmid stabilization system protein ParE|nr:type II toxin-antitoxin system RelE/ParE family toxin [Clostridiales Family XIII bacterium]